MAAAHRWRRAEPGHGSREPADEKPNSVYYRRMPPEEVSSFCSEHKVLCCESIFLLILTFAGFVTLTIMADVRRAKPLTSMPSRVGDKVV